MIGVMKAMSKSDEDIRYGLRLPTRRCAALLSSSTEYDRTGSTGRCVAAGGAASFIFFSAAATTSQASSTRTTRTSPRRRLVRFSASDVIPMTLPSAAKTGPPVLPSATMRSVTISWDSTRLTLPRAMPRCSRRGTPIVKIFSPAAGGFSSLPQPSGNARIDATAAGSMRMTATSRAGSDTRTLPATLIAGVSCTSIAVDAPIDR